MLKRIVSPEFVCGVAPELTLASKRTLTYSYEINDVLSFARAGRYVPRVARAALSDRISFVWHCERPRRSRG